MTKENKEKYVEAYINYIFNNQCSAQIKTFKEDSTECAMKM